MTGQGRRQDHQRVTSKCLTLNIAINYTVGREIIWSMHAIDVIDALDSSCVAKRSLHIDSISKHLLLQGLEPDPS